MNESRIIPGVVLSYQYLWARQAGSGETEGRKSRPAAVGFRLARPDGDILLLFPITTSQPTATRKFVEIPETEKHRAGLDPDRRQWIILDETNVDSIEGSYYLDQNAVLGYFSRAFFVPLMRRIAGYIAAVEKVSRR